MTLAAFLLLNLGLLLLAWGGRPERRAALAFYLVVWFVDVEVQRRGFKELQKESRPET